MRCTGATTTTSLCRRGMTTRRASALPQASGTLTTCGDGCTCHRCGCRHAYLQSGFQFALVCGDPLGDTGSHRAALADLPDPLTHLNWPFLGMDVQPRTTWAMPTALRSRRRAARASIGVLQSGTRQLGRPPSVRGCNDVKPPASRTTSKGITMMVECRALIAVDADLVRCVLHVENKSKLFIAVRNAVVVAAAVALGNGF